MIIDNGNKLGLLVFAENKYFKRARLHLLKRLSAPPRARRAHLGRRKDLSPPGSRRNANTSCP